VGDPDLEFRLRNCRYGSRFFVVSFSSSTKLRVLLLHKSSRKETSYIQ
jgi:hypothetical protein